MAQLRDELTEFKRSLNGSMDPPSRKALDQLSGAMSTINDSLRMLAIYSGGADRRRARDIAAELENFRELSEPILQAYGTKIEIDCPSSAVVRTEMRPENFH